MDLPGNDDYRDDLGALDFSSIDQREMSAASAFGEFVSPAAHEDTGTELDALHSLTEVEEEEELETFTVANPQGSVSVSTLLDGRIEHIQLSEQVTRMSESQLADEIFVLADLARQKARAAQHTFMMEHMSEMAEEDPESSALLREFVGMTLNLPSPEEAAAAEEEVFSTRYDVDYTARYNDK